MKSLIVPLLATASFSTFLICGMVAASSFNLHYTPHKFTNINDAIWTSSPVRVDRSEQAFQREPGQAVVQTAAASETPAAAAPENSSTLVLPVSLVADQQQPATVNEPIAVGWCQARYRSYRESDNSYQPFSGGPRQQCNAPGQVPRTGMTANEGTPNMAQNSEPSHAAWCGARYSSYRPADDTFQPLGGGDRRACVSPLSSGANG